MATIYHRAERTDGALYLCSHVHLTVISAVACISAAGEYIVARENGVFRTLTDVEQVEYEYAVYGRAIERSIAPMEGYRKKRFT